MAMDRIAGPECSRCGCEDSDLVKTQRTWHGEVEVRRCNHCGKKFTHTVEPDEEDAADEVAVYYDVRCVCPSCNAENPPVTSAPGKGVRWHRCRRCGTRFKSVSASKK